jgi:hypothetical protein
MKLPTAAVEHLPLKIFAILWQCKLARAQNPLSDLGGWPPGAITLLGGLYTALYTLNQSNFDVLPPICFSVLWHYIPVLKQYLKSGELGTTFTTIVLESAKSTKQSVDLRLEWDAVTFTCRILQNEEDPIPRSVSSPQGQGQVAVWFKIPAENDNDKVKATVDITAKDVETDHLEIATNVLLKYLPDDGPFDLQVLLRKWRGFLMYQRGQGRWRNNEMPKIEELDHYADELVKEMKGGRKESRLEKELGKLKKFEMEFLFENPFHDDGELSPLQWWDNTPINGSELAALLAFSRTLLKTQKSTVNPFLLCLQLWRMGKLDAANNLHITLPTSNIFKVEAQNNRKTLSYTLDVGNSACYIDGLTASRAAYPWIFTIWRVMWLTSTLCACVMAFFVIIASNATPTLATALALSFASPSSNDHSWRDAGCPPSWNGRIRIRWGDGFACGIFSGRHTGKPGRTGTSFTRCGLVLITCWATWAGRAQLRSTLGFGDDRGISTWVKWVAIFVLASFTLVAYINAFGLRRYGQTRLALFLAFYAGVFALIAFLFAWRIVHEQETWWISLIITEAGCTLVGSIFPAIVIAGISHRNGGLLLWSRFAWLFLILVSCFNG